MADITSHHREGPPVGLGAISSERHSGAVPMSDDEAASATGGSAFQLWVYYEGRERNWW